MQLYQKNLEEVGMIEKVIGHEFKDKELLLLAFVHRSYFNERRDEVEGHNERLEFLGDSVLGLLVSKYLYERFPERPEGELSHIRSHLVDGSACAELVKSVGLDGWILLGKGESGNVGKGRDTILADLFEALLGALYLDGGLEEVLVFFERMLKPRLEVLVGQPMRNWKAELQDWAQRERRVVPRYEVLEETGPDHCKEFRVGVYLEEQLLEEGVGMSKKEAEAAAAEKVMRGL